MVQLEEMETRRLILDWAEECGPLPTDSSVDLEALFLWNLEATKIQKTWRSWGFGGGWRGARARDRGDEGKGLRSASDGAEGGMPLGALGHAPPAKPWVECWEVQRTADVRQLRLPRVEE